MGNLPARSQPPQPPQLTHSPPSATAPVTLSQAQALNDRGQQELLQGQPEQALATWQQATALYQQLGDSLGTIGSRFNQARALEELGEYSKACKTLLLALQQGGDCDFADSNTGNDRLESVLYAFETHLADPFAQELRIFGLQSFGNLLRLQGDLENAQRVLSISQSLTDQPLSASINWINQGKVAQDRFRSAQNLYQRARKSTQDLAFSEAIAAAEQALEFYDRSITLSQTLPYPEIHLQAQLLRLGLLLELHQWFRAIGVSEFSELSGLAGLAGLEERLAQIDSQVKALQQSELMELRPSRTAIYLNLNFAESLMQFDPTVSTDFVRPYIDHALEQAKILQDQASVSEASGLLGQVEERNRDWEQAIDHTQTALVVAQNQEMPELAYQWQFQLGRLYRDQGNLSQAISAYEDALDSLDAVRTDLLTVGNEVQFSFQEAVEPIYRQFMALLLEQEKFEQATTVLNRLQIAELENFLDCNLSITEDEFQETRQINPDTAVFHVILLNDRLDVVVQLPESSAFQHHSVPVTQAEVLQQLDKLRTALEKSSILPTALDTSAQFYDWLIRPFEATLESHQINTLAFTLDSPFRDVPMAALYDERTEQYLIEKGYAVALLPNSNLNPSSDWTPLRSDVLAFGLSEVSEESDDYQKFESLEFVEKELAWILGIDNISGREYLDEAFTTAGFQEVMAPTTASIVHLATHGQFSSIPEETFLLTWDKRLTIDDFVKVLQQRGQGADPIELLVLSACETASGDARATLGLAGLAIRSGAHSTIASLWSITDETTAQLMKYFYQELATGNVPKAEALRQAQLNLRSQGYYAPRYWAPYLLISDLEYLDSAYSD